ncbi:NADP-reducing hydrogenase subunit HndC [Limihaloglobus sulfuriphilus]|uniref:NADP-reducing hydrogenase subunit HndC n=2 Tax=Limihaloglobus sulfuriphilus TaxID=1851148 RepID=A0A1Q2MET5_9BACT|nr:NADP-reducing hydrogenase subunit HndC [Limihaloglobus sulfuriphilus]
MLRMKEKITVSFNNKEHRVDPGQTIMQAADKLGFHIPRLCYHPKLSIEGACRVCIVEVEGSKNYVASCATPIAEGMKIHTDTLELRRARRDIVELILDNHPQDCHTCERDGSCELQRLSAKMGIRGRHFEGEMKSYEEDLSSEAVVRNPNKCILCGRCVRMCSQIQKVSNLGLAGRGFKTVVMPAFDMPMKDSVCTACGQCINICPTAAFLEKAYIDEIYQALNDPDVVKVVNVAPSVRASIGESFGYDPGTNTEGKMFAAMRKLGFDYVFDSQFTADLTIMEEASELVDRIQNGGVLPMITSCSSGWMKCVEQFYPELLPNISTCKSPMSMMGALIKSYFAEQNNYDPKKIINVGVMPCTAKKYEAARPELKVNGVNATDYVLTTREFAWMVKSSAIDFRNLDSELPDNPLGSSSGAGAIFGATGGVMEAAIRTAYYIVTGKELDYLDVQSARGLNGVKESLIDFDGLELRVAVAHGLGNAAKLLDHVKQNPERYHFVEIMGCPGGCVGGGGQPYPLTNSIPLDEECLAKRASVLYDIDRDKPDRRSHDNPDIKKLYNEYLGEPLGKKSHKLLHTHYEQKFPKGIFEK